MTDRPAATTSVEGREALIAELRDALRSSLDWIDAVPKETADTLPAMPGFGRDWAESLLVDQPPED